MEQKKQLREAAEKTIYEKKIEKGTRELGL
jgi:hypothetical protein